MNISLGEFFVLCKHLKTDQQVRVKMCCRQHLIIPGSYNNILQVITILDMVPFNGRECDCRLLSDDQSSFEVHRFALLSMNKAQSSKALMTGKEAELLKFR